MVCLFVHFMFVLFRSYGIISGHQQSFMDRVPSNLRLSMRMFLYTVCVYYLGFGAISGHQKKVIHSKLSNLKVPIH